MNTDDILKSFHSPFNIHVLNLVNTVYSLDKNTIHTLEEHNIYIHQFSLDFEHINSMVRELNMDEYLLHSPLFLFFSKRLETTLQDVLHSKGIETLPPHVRNMTQSLIHVLQTYRTKGDTNNLTHALELLEQAMDDIDSEDIQEFLIRTFEDKTLAQKFSHFFIELFSSIYGLVASIPTDSVWKDIVSDQKIFKNVIQSLQTNV